MTVGPTKASGRLAHFAIDLGWNHGDLEVDASSGAVFEVVLEADPGRLDLCRERPNINYCLIKSDT